MRRFIMVCVLLCMAGLLFAQQAITLVSPNVFVRGMATEQGIRYTATIIKPTDGAALRNLSVEITLPSDAQLVEMLVPRQIQFDVIRRDRQNRLTLIWQISRVESSINLDTFSFTLAQPLMSDLEFYAQYEDETGSLQVQNFLEVPTLVTNTVQIVDDDAIIPEQLSATLLASDFNPPAEYGDIWWCSLLQLDGVGQPLQVIVPLRRPIAPFTELVLFQQHADSTWTQLENSGVVTADGQYVIYEHPGGLVASGGGVEIQPAVVTADQLVIVNVGDTALPTIVVPPPADIAPTPANITDGSSNTIIISENTPIPAPTQGITDGSSNTVIISESTPLPFIEATTTNPKTGSGVIVVGASNATPTGNAALIVGSKTNATLTTGIVVVTPTLLPTLGDFTDGTVRFINGTPLATPGVTDGSSNTLLLGEGTPTRVPATGNLSDGSVRFINGTPVATQGITDGSSNTFLVGEGTSTRVSAPGNLSDGSVRFINGTPVATQGVADGSSNTILLGERTPTLLPTIDDFTDGTVRFINGTPVATPGVADGSSNTILLGEGTSTRVPGPGNLSDGSVRFINGTPLATPGVTDGSSNTLLLGEGTSTRVPATGNLSDGSVRFINGTPLATPGVTDGSSNTLLLGEGTSTRVPASGNLSDGSVRFINGTPVATQSITDGSSNTLLLGEGTSTLLPFIEATATLLPFIEATATSVKTGNGFIVVGAVNAPASPTLSLTAESKTGRIATSTTPLPTVNNVTDGTSNTIAVGELSATLRPIPTATSLPIPTLRPPVVIAPAIVLNPEPQISTSQTLGTVRVVLFATSTTSVQQCTVGGINCAVLTRKAGTRLK